MGIYNGIISGMARRLLIGLAMLLTVLVLVASCQTQAPAPAPAPVPAPAPAPTPGPTAADVELEISGFAFKPNTITIEVGTTVTWTNMDSAPHTVTTRETLFDSGRMSTGDTFSYTFEQSGTYEYYCTIHPSMVATITVE
jgi:plastocyanin